MVLQIVGIVVAVCVGLVVLEVLIVGFAPGFAVPKQSLKGGKKRPEDAVNKDGTEIQ